MLEEVQVVKYAVDNGLAYIIAIGLLAFIVNKVSKALDEICRGLNTIHTEAVQRGETLIEVRERVIKIEDCVRGPNGCQTKNDAKPG